MDSVKRYDYETESAGDYLGDYAVMREFVEGEYVLYTDYAALQSRADRLAEALERIRRVWDLPEAVIQNASEALAAYRKPASEVE